MRTCWMTSLSLSLSLSPSLSIATSIELLGCIIAAVWAKETKVQDPQKIKRFCLRLGQKQRQRQRSNEKDGEHRCGKEHANGQGHRMQLSGTGLNSVRTYNFSQQRRMVRHQSYPELLQDPSHNRSGDRRSIEKRSARKPS